MENSHTQIRTLIERYRQHFRMLLETYPSDGRKTILARIVDQICEAVTCHAELVLLEGDDRFTISESHYHQLLEDYLPLFSAIKKLPRATDRSIYEITLVSCLDTIVKSHCEGQEPE